MELSYKGEDEFIGSAKRQILLESRSNKKDLVLEFKRYYNDIKNSSKLDRSEEKFEDTVISFLRQMKLFINNHGKCLDNFFIEKEMFEYLIDLLNMDDAGEAILEESLSLLNWYIILIDIKNPISFFEGNEEYVINTMRKYIELDYEDFNKNILTFMKLIFDGTEKSENFIFSILSPEMIQKLLQNNSCVCYGVGVADLILKITGFSIGADKVEYIINTIKLILEKSQQVSFINCFHSLTKIVGYVQEKNRDEREKDEIKCLFEKDEELPLFCIKSLQLNDYRIPESIFLFLSKMCEAKFNIKMYEPVINEAYEALDIYSRQFANVEKLRMAAACVIRNAFYYNFDCDPDFFIEKSVDFEKRLSISIQDDAFSVAFVACQAFLCIIIHSPRNKLEEIFLNDIFFDVYRRIVDFEIKILLFLEATNAIFNFAESQNYIQMLIKKFDDYDFINALEEIKYKSEDKDEIQQLNEFLNHFQEAQKKYSEQ